MEAIFHPLTYEMIGNIEFGENANGWFAEVMDGEEGYNVQAEAFFRTKRAAVAWIKREFKLRFPNYNK